MSLWLGVWLSQHQTGLCQTKPGMPSTTIVHVHIVWCLLQWVVPELVATAFIPIFLLLTLHWVVFLVTAPFAGYLIYRLHTNVLKGENLAIFTWCSRPLSKLLKWIVRKPTKTSLNAWFGSRQINFLSACMYKWEYCLQVYDPASWVHGYVRSDRDP